MAFLFCSIFPSQTYKHKTNLQRRKTENYTDKGFGFQELSDFPTDAWFSKLLPAFILQIFLSQI